eukprot:GHVN01030750.1.p1 GENE.GHVN01030750.1~~GHVN01030750.1.p1  ORF type:complete len:107 (-),score=3.54 GHVN01030750.1:410-685(-)
MDEIRQAIAPMQPPGAEVSLQTKRLQPPALLVFVVILPLTSPYSEWSRPGIHKRWPRLRRLTTPLWPTWVNEVYHDEKYIYDQITKLKVQN